MKRALRIFGVAIILAGLASPDARTQGTFVKNHFREDFSQSIPWRNRWYVGMDMGAGWMRLIQNDIPSERVPRFSMGFYCGYKVTSWLRAGMNLNGWLIESFGYPGNYNYNPAKGVSVSNIFAQVMIFPFPRCNLYIDLAGGHSEYINYHPDSYNASGMGGWVAVGYEKDLLRRLGCLIKVYYARGQFDDVNIPNVATVTNQHYDVVGLTLGFTYH